MSRSIRQTDMHSAEGRQESSAAIEQIEDGIEVPDYLSEVAPLSQNEYARWDAHISSRTVWRESELITLYQLVKLETRIFQALGEIMSESLTITTDRGTVARNPAHLSYDALQRDSLTLRRTLGIDADRGTVQRNSKKVQGRKPRATKSKVAAPEKPKLLKLPKS